MKIYTNYCEIPDFLKPYLETDAMKRLQGIDMNCGVNETSFPLFVGMDAYTRFEHSLGVALLTWRYSGNEVQTLASLFHDISTPAFSHVADFMQGDYMQQEATESLTEVMIRNDRGIMDLLEQAGIDVKSVSDYHLYPIADNDSPRLSADRLEYTLGNLVNYGFGSLEEVRQYLGDLCVGINDEGKEEIMFIHEECAESFAKRALQCGAVYSSDQNRYAMQRLSELLNRAIAEGILVNGDLLLAEADLIDKLMQSSLKEEWVQYAQLSHIDTFDHEVEGSLKLKVKQRYIDPYVKDRGRISALSAKMNSEMLRFANRPFDEYLKGDTY